MRLTTALVALVEHNNISTTYTADWRIHRTDTLQQMASKLPQQLNPAQRDVMLQLVDYLKSTSLLELGYSLAGGGTSPTPKNIWPVTCPLCDPSSYLNGDMILFDAHLPPAIRKVRQLDARKKQTDRVTHSKTQLKITENMLHAQELYKHIRTYSNECFLHAAYETILDNLYPRVQHQMTPWRNPALMNFPSLPRSRRREQMGKQTQKTILIE